MFSFLKSKNKSGLVGLEIRADGISLALSHVGSSGSFQVSSCLHRACTSAQRQETLDDLIDELGVSGLPCHLVLSSAQYKIYPIEKPKVEDSELSEAARWKVKDLLDFELEEAVTDVYKFPEDALRGRPAQINVVVSRKSVIADNVKLLSESRLKLEKIDIIDLAIRNVALRISDGDQRTTAVLYLRDGAGIIVLCKGDAMYFSRHFDFSLQSLNEPSQQESVIQQLALEVQRSFDYFQSQLGQVPPQKLFLIGPTPLVPLGNMLGGNISAKVEALDLSLCFEGEQSTSQQEINAFAAIGAALGEIQS